MGPSRGVELESRITVYGRDQGYATCTLRTLRTRRATAVAFPRGAERRDGGFDLEEKCRRNWADGGRVHCRRMGRPRVGIQWIGGWNEFDEQLTAGDERSLAGREGVPGRGVTSRNSQVWAPKKDGMDMVRRAPKETEMRMGLLVVRCRARAISPPAETWKRVSRRAA